MGQRFKSALGQMRPQTKIILISHDKKELKAAYKHLALVDPKIKTVKLPRRTKRFTVLRSPHVNKTAREQFELFTHKWVLFTCVPQNLLERYLDKQRILRQNPGVSVMFK